MKKKCCMSVQTLKFCECLCLCFTRKIEREREGGREGGRKKGNYSVWMSDC